MADPLTDAQQEVQKYRDLLRNDSQNPQRDDWRNALAGALCGRLAPALARPSPQDAAAAAREGIGITRQLLDENAFPASRQGFAKQIAEAAGYLPAAEAVTETEVSVAIYRELSAARPDDTEQLGWLAWVLSGRLAPRQAAAGQTAPAAASAQEAVDITRRLLAGPALPPNAAGYAQLIADVAQYLPATDAVTATLTAIDVYRRLSAADPGSLAEKDALADALAGRLAPRQAAAAQPDGAAQSAREAIAITKTIVDEPAYQGNLTGYGRRVLITAQYLPEEEMLAATEYAVGLYRRAAHRDPYNLGLNRDLVWAMSIWADRLERAGRHSSAAVVRADADKAAHNSELSLAGQDVRFPPRTALSAVSRHVEQLDLFGVGEDGRVWSVWWNHKWEDYFPLGTKTFPAGTTLCAITRDTDFLDVFTVDGDGHLCTAWWSADGGWKTEWPAIPGGKAFPALTPVTGLARNSDLMDVWLVDADGVVNGVWWNGTWKNWYVLPGPKFPPRTPITSLSRDDDHMDIWGVDEHGAVWTIGWNGTWDPRNWTRLDGRTFPPGSRIAAASRDSGKLEIWALDAQGAVWGTWWDDGWHGWYTLPGQAFPPGTPLTGLSRHDGSHLEVYGVGADGQVWLAWFDGDTWQHPVDGGGTSFWFPLVPAGNPPVHQTFPQLTPVATVVRSLKPVIDLAIMDLFAVGADGGIHGARWVDGWLPWYRIPVPVVRFRQTIVSGGLAALGGWAGVNICVDGSVQWYGHAHDSSGIDGYDFGVAFYVKGDKRMIAVSYDGDVSPSHDDTWWEFIYPPDTYVLAALSEFLGAQDHMNTQYTSHIGQTLEGLVSFALKWFVGDVTGPTGVVVFLGVEIGSIISTGSLAGGAVVMQEALWMAGPANSLLALGAAAIADFAYKERPLPPEVYRLLDDNIFGGQLPPWDSIRLTNVSGLSYRPFTVPAHRDGMILVNMGEDGYADPVNFHLNRVGATGVTNIPYSVLVHELTHAWQIKHSGMEIALLVNSLSAATQGDDAYRYGPAGPEYASGFTTEGQAQIVSDWFSKYARLDVPATPTQPAHTEADFSRLTGNAAVSDPYFRYIQDNIRTGDY